MILSACRCGESWRGGPPLRQLVQSTKHQHSSRAFVCSAALFVCSAPIVVCLLVVALRSGCDVRGGSVEGWGTPKICSPSGSQTPFANFMRKSSTSPRFSAIYLRCCPNDTANSFVSDYLAKWLKRCRSVFRQNNTKRGGRDDCCCSLFRLLGFRRIRRLFLRRALRQCLRKQRTNI